MRKETAAMFRQIGPEVVLATLALHAGFARAETSQVVLNRDSSTIVLEAYAPNIIRVTLSLLKGPSVAPPGFGFVAAPSATGWTRQESGRGDAYRSSRLVVTVAKNLPGQPTLTN